MSKKSANGAVDERRKQRRISVGLDVIVRGQDRDGRRFEVTSQILDVSRTGASFLTPRDIEMGADVEILIPKLGLSGRPSRDDYQTLAHVVRVIDDPVSGQRVIGVQFVGPKFNRVFITEESTEPA